MIYKQIIYNLLLAFLLLVLPAILLAENIFASEMPATQEVQEPVLVVKGSDNGKDGSVWFKGNGTYIYRLCTHWDGPFGGTPSKELFRMRGSIRGLAVGEQLQFYIASASGSVTGSDDHAAVTVPIGDGLSETVYTYPGGGYTNREESSSLPASANANAWLTRTGTGAMLEIDGVPSAHCGEESLYFNSTSPTIRITISNAELAAWDRLEKSVSDSGPGSAGNGTYSYSLTVSAQLPDQGGVELNGCSDLGVGKESVVTAKVNKEGGTYRFWAEPQEMLSIKSSGPTATLRGSSPGRGTLYVEYTQTDGKKAQDSQAATCVLVESYNGGQAIPQIAFYDIDGKKKSGIITVPVAAQPGDAAELVTFEPADPGVLSAQGVGSEVTLQGITTGKTTLQASTKCGEDTGQAVEVEVVNCDDETVAALERMRKAALETLQQANDELKRIAGSKEFEKAKEEIVESLGEMLAKAGLTIVTSGNAPTGAIEAASDIADAGAAISEMIASGSQTEFYENAIKAAAGKLAGSAASAVIGVIDVQKAAQKFGDNWAQLNDYENSLKNALESFEKADKDLQKYIRLQQLCRGEKTEPPKKDAPKAEPKTEPKPKPKPEPVKPKSPAKPTAKTYEPPAQEPQTREPAAEDEVMVDPERPVSPPRQVGLPYEPGDCGCNNSKALTVSSADFSSLSTGVKNLSNCVENFKNASLTDYQNALQELSTLTGSLSNTLKTDAAAFLVNAKESKPRLDSIVSRVKAYDESGKAFLNKMEKCPESLTTGMEIFQSAEKITIDSVKAHY